MESAKGYFAETILEENNPVDQVFSFEEGVTNELSYSGSKPKGGILTLSKSGEIGLAIHNNEWCAIKSKTDTNVKLIKYEKDKCVIEENQSESAITLNGDSTIYLEIGETYNELGATVKTEDGKYTTVIKLENEIVSSIDTSKAGVYTITYNVDDESVIRTVIVLDMKPIIKMSEENETYVKEKEVLLNVSGIKPNKVESFTYEVKKDGVSVKTETVNVLTKTLTLNETGSYEVIVTVTDNNNHENTLSKNYKIDATKPIYTVKSEEIVTIAQGENNVITNYFNNPVWSVSGTGTVICKNGDTIVTNTDSLDIGTYTITCTAIGITGLSTSANKRINVKQKEQTGLEVITNNDVGSNGSIRKDNLGNKRYAGSNPNNWVCFGTENEACDEEHLYRIIGIIDGKVKLMKNSFYSTSKSWDTTGGSNGSNNWNRPADLKTELNGISFYENTNYIDETSKNYIANGTWYTGGINGPYTLADFEDAERSSSSSGYIGLMSITDFGYGSNNASCERTTDLSTSNNVCISNNYLFNSSTHQWVITPNSGDSYNMWFVYMGGSVRRSFTSNTFGVRPSLFLKPEVKIKSGKGTEQEPYRLSM